jgi:hypothetical protein
MGKCLPHLYAHEHDNGIVRITAEPRHWTKNVERLCGTELAPLGESGGAVFAAVEMALLIEMIVYG